MPFLHCKLSRYSRTVMQKAWNVAWLYALVQAIVLGRVASEIVLLSVLQLQTDSILRQGPSKPNKDKRSKTILALYCQRRNESRPCKSTTSLLTETLLRREYRLAIVLSICRLLGDHVPYDSTTRGYRRDHLLLPRWPYVDYLSQFLQLQRQHLHSEQNGQRRIAGKNSLL